MRLFYLILGVLLVAVSCSEKKETTKPYTLFVGTYTDGESEGIYGMKFDSENGILDSIELKAALPNPSFLAVSGDKKNLYAVQETSDFDSLGGGVTAFTLKDGILKELNSKGSGGAHPCHIEVSEDGQLAISNYTGGNLAIFDLNTDGSLGQTPQIVDHKVLDTAKAAHVHKAHFTKDGLFTSDLGLDALKRYQKVENKWIPAHQNSLDLPEGAGPRHFEFDKTGNFLYVINELNATVTVFERDDEGSYNPIQTEGTLASDYEGNNSCADIHLSPDGRFLYGSNRGENTIVIFSVDEETGKISLIGRKSVHGDWPRNFTIDPSGNFLLVANQKSSNITVFRRDQTNGTLEFLNETSLPNPVCLLFLD
ncbi:lactonase family protein [Flagellimonas nanhaiensis]|uniref:Lactonase family protein n=1 Tax=Flagellimonas nanhaiensis TaxID=2292706 RepID=A0A371JR20_9FLAO|nr:lactonase family protein [Allomuricauda nanhaiensis]RDY59954.1 lactonase family protein [Allomuricauda nanhaiensis]